MNCATVKQEIKAYIDGELGAWTRRLVSRHIAKCEDCRREMQEMAELTNEVRTAPNVSVPSGLRDKVLGNLTFQPSGAARTWWGTIPTAAKVAGATLAAVALVAVMMPVFQLAKEAAPRAMLARRQALTSTDFDNRMPPQTVPAPKPTAQRSRVAGALDKRASAKLAVEYTSPSQPAASVSLMVIKTAELAVRVRSFERASDQAVTIAKSAGGYVTDTSSSSEQGTPTEGCMTLRVPAEAFERTLSRLAKLGTVTSRSIAGEDVTGETVDLESRLRNLRAEERQYLDIMTRARRIPDVVTVTNELSRVRGEIEESQGRLKYLRSSAAMSTIDLTLKQIKPGTGKVRGASIINAFNGALGSLKETVKALATVAVWLLVYSPFWALPIAIWFYARKRVVAREQTTESR